jgi:nicotinamide-nucleotide amidase
MNPLPPEALPEVESLDLLVEALAAALLRRGERVATAESCTGGGVATAFTALAGSSRWFERGFVTYSNESKHEMLGLSLATLQGHGAVSAQTVAEMAKGALTHSHAEWSLAISGIAGPDGGTPDKPVGTVCFGWAGPSGLARCECHVFPGDRQAVREQAVRLSIKGLLDLINNCI